jgi:hypothetical protein
VADADPEDEVRDVERPVDRVVDAGQSEAHVHLIEPGADARRDDRAEEQHERPEAP